MKSLINKVVIFGEDAGEGESGIQVFWDDFANVDGDGEPISNYYPGDSREFLVIMPEKYRLLSVVPTSGAVAANGAVSRQQIDRILFSEKDVLQPLTRSPVGGVTPTWYCSPPVITVVDNQVKANRAPTIADVSYSYAALQYTLTAPSTLNIGSNGDDDWPIGVVVYAEVKI